VADGIANNYYLASDDVSYYSRILLSQNLRKFDNSLVLLFGADFSATFPLDDFLLECSRNLGRGYVNSDTVSMAVEELTPALKHQILEVISGEVRVVRDLRKLYIYIFTDDSFCSNTYFIMKQASLHNLTSNHWVLQLPGQVLASVTGGL